MSSSVSKTDSSSSGPVREDFFNAMFDALCADFGGNPTSEVRQRQRVRWWKSIQGEAEDVVGLAYRRLIHHFAERAAKMGVASEVKFPQLPQFLAALAEVKHQRVRDAGASFSTEQSGATRCSLCSGSGEVRVVSWRDGIISIEHYAAQGYVGGRYTRLRCVCPMGATTSDGAQFYDPRKLLEGPKPGASGTSEIRKLPRNYLTRAVAEAARMHAAGADMADVQARMIRMLDEP